MLLYKGTIFILDLVFCYLIKSERYKLPSQDRSALPRFAKIPNPYITISTKFVTTVLTYLTTSIIIETLPILTLGALTIAQDSLAFALHSQHNYVPMGPQQVIDLTSKSLTTHSSVLHYNAKLIKFLIQRQPEKNFNNQKKYSIKWTDSGFLFF